MYAVIPGDLPMLERSCFGNAFSETCTGISLFLYSLIVRQTLRDCKARLKRTSDTMTKFIYQPYYAKEIWWM
jgi:hypothetical protein